MRLKLTAVGLALLALVVPASAQRLLYLGTFYAWSDKYGDNPGIEGNATVIVEPGVARRATKALVLASGLAAERTPATIAWWVDGFTATELDQKIALVRRDGLPILGYVDRGDWTFPPTRPDWIGVQCYRLKGETLPAFDARVRKMIERSYPKLVALIVQTYDTNDSLTGDVLPQFAYYTDWALRYPYVVAILAFSDGRSTPTGLGGLRVHPDWRTNYREMVKTLIGLPPATPFVPAAPTGLRRVIRVPFDGGAH